MKYIFYYNLYKPFNIIKKLIIIFYKIQTVEPCSKHSLHTTQIQSMDPLDDEELKDIDMEISRITTSLRFNMIQTRQQSIYNNSTYNLGMQIMHNMSSTMFDMRMPETPNQFPSLPDVLLDNILMCLSPIMMTSLRCVCRRFCYQSRRINLRYTHQYQPGLNLWVLYSNVWLVGRILPCGVNGVTEIIYNTHQVNEFHIQMEVGTIAVKTVDVLAKISLLKVPPAIPKYVENTMFNDPHHVCPCGVYIGTCNDSRLTAPKSSCWVLRLSIKSPVLVEIGTIYKFEKYTRMQSHIDISTKLEKKYGISYNTHVPFSKKIAKICVKSVSEYKNIFRNAKPIYNENCGYEYDDVYNMEEYHDIPSDDYDDYEDYDDIFD
jgi:hypothetical protein